MNKLILTVLITLASVSTMAHADCSVFESSLKRIQRNADELDPIKGRILFGENIYRSESMLKECLASEHYWEVEHARRAKLPAPKIGQLKQETSWGNPDKISITTTPKGTLEIQFFPGGYSLMYDNNRLIMIHAVK